MDCAVCTADAPITSSNREKKSPLKKTVININIEVQLILCLLVVAVTLCYAVSLLARHAMFAVIFD